MFPTDAITAANLLIASNRKTCVLNGPFQDTDTTVNVDDTSGFGSEGVITVEAEIIHYSSKTATTFVVATGGRGYDSTVASYHAGGTTAYARNIAAHHNLLATHIAAIEAAMRVAANPTFAGMNLTGHLLFTDNTYDIGATGATRPRDLFLSRNALMEGTLGVTGKTTLTAAVGVGGGPSLNAMLYLTGAMTAASGASAVFDMNANLTGIQGENLYGAWLRPTLTRAASGSAHPIVASIKVDKPSLAGTVGATLAATLYVTEAPTEGASNYAIYVASGAVYVGGNVGIGTTNPAAKMHIIGPVGGESIRFTDDTYNTLRIVHSSTGLQFQGGDGIAWLIANANNSITLQPTGDRFVGIGTTSPAVSALLDLTSTTGALLLTRLTTAQRDALTPVNGMLIYNSSLGKLQGYEAGAWASLI